MHKAVPPEIPVEECVERAVESDARGSVHPPRNREVRGSEKSRSGPCQSNRQQREQERNDPPFTRVCAVAVHTSPARLRKAEQTSGLLEMRLPPPIAAGKLRVKEIALAVEWLPEEWPDGIPNLKQLLVVAPLTPPSYSSLQRNLHPSPGGRSPPGNGPGTCLPPNLVNLFEPQFRNSLTFPIFHRPGHLLAVLGNLAANRCSHFSLILQHHLIGVLVGQPATVQNACQKSAGVIFAVALPFVCNSVRVRNGEHVALGCVLDHARVGLVPVLLPKSDERIIVRNRSSAPVIHVSYCLGFWMADPLVRHRQCVSVRG